MKKTLIISGCSWTDPLIVSSEPTIPTATVRSWPKWYDIVAEKLDMQVVNLGKSAAGNEYICYSIIDYIMGLSKAERDNIGLVIAAWSQAKRTDFQYRKNDDDIYVERLFRTKNIQFKLDKNYIWDSILYTDPLRGDLFYKIKQSVRYMFNLQTFCKHYNIPYKMVQAIELNRIPSVGTEFNIQYAMGSSQRSLTTHSQIQHYMDKEVVKELHKNVYFNKIDEKHFIGWPTVSDLGGKCLVDLLNKKNHFVSNLESKVSNYHLDDHPNKVGYEIIAKYILENI